MKLDYRHNYGRGYRKEPAACFYKGCDDLIYASAERYCAKHKIIRGRETRRQWRIDNPEKVKQMAKDSYWRIGKARKKVYYSDPKNKKHRAEYGRNYQQQHKKPCDNCGTPVKETSFYCHKCSNMLIKRGFIKNMSFNQPD